MNCIAEPKEQASMGTGLLIYMMASILEDARMVTLMANTCYLSNSLPKYNSVKKWQGGRNGLRGSREGAEVSMERVWGSRKGAWGAVRE